MADMPFLFHSVKSKQALFWENFGESKQEKEKQEKGEFDADYNFYFHYQIHLPILPELNLITVSFECFKPSSGFTDPAYPPPNLPSL
jgi:hypothetical protein